MMIFNYVGDEKVSICDGTMVSLIKHWVSPLKFKPYRINSLSSEVFGTRALSMAVNLDSFIRRFCTAL